MKDAIKEPDDGAEEITYPTDDGYSCRVLVQPYLPYLRERHYWSNDACKVNDDVNYSLELVRMRIRLMVLMDSFSPVQMMLADNIM